MPALPPFAFPSPSRPARRAADRDNDGGLSALPTPKASADLRPLVPATSRWSVRPRTVRRCFVRQDLRTARRPARYVQSTGTTPDRGHDERRPGISIMLPPSPSSVRRTRRQARRGATHRFCARAFACWIKLSSRNSSAKRSSRPYARRRSRSAGVTVIARAGKAPTSACSRSIIVSLLNHASNGRNDVLEGPNDFWVFPLDHQPVAVGN